MNVPRVINAANIQEAWIEAAKILAQNSWEFWNLIVHISTPNTLDELRDAEICGFLNSRCDLPVKDVAYTIFPSDFYRRLGSSERLFEKYPTFYRRLKYAGPGHWGNYFWRMTNYQTSEGKVNQLRNIINAIRASDKTYRVAYTIVIEKPGNETTRRRGAPCLNYIALQIEPGVARQRLGLLAVYRNHDFLNKAYGNYTGLRNLLLFLANEANCDPGPLTCVSSHAYVTNNKPHLNGFLGG